MNEEREETAGFPLAESRNDRKDAEKAFLEAKKGSGSARKDDKRDEKGLAPLTTPTSFSVLSERSGWSWW